MLAADLVRASVPTIVFGQSRNTVEVMLRYLRDAVATRPQRTDKGAASTRAHHGLPRRLLARAAARHRAAAARAARSSRRRDQRARARASTSASSTRWCAPATRARSRPRGSASGARGGAASRASACSWRRARRSTSTSRASPSFLLGAPVEEARIDPDNVEILVQHLKCAAFELPFKRGEAFGSLGARGDHARRSGSSRATACCTSRRHVPLGGRRLPGERRVAAQRRLGQRRHHRRRARSHHRRARLARRRTRCCTSRPSTSTTASAGRSSASTTRTTRRSCGKVEPDYWTERDDVRRRSRVLEESATAHAVGGRPEAHRGRAAGARWRWSRRSSATRRSSSTRTRTPATATCACPRCRCTRRRSGSRCPRRRAQRAPAGARRPSTACAASGVALETVATLALMCDPRDLGTTLGDADDDDASEAVGATQGARRPATRLQPDAVSLRARPGRHGPRRAHLGAARRARSRARFASSRRARAAAAARRASGRERHAQGRRAGAPALGRAYRVTLQVCAIRPWRSRRSGMGRFGGDALTGLGLRLEAPPALAGRNELHPLGRDPGRADEQVVRVREERGLVVLEGLVPDELERPARDEEARPPQAGSPAPWETTRRSWGCRSCASACSRAGCAPCGTWSMYSRSECWGNGSFMAPHGRADAAMRKERPRRKTADCARSGFAYPTA